MKFDNKNVDMTSLLNQIARKCVPFWNVRCGYFSDFIADVELAFEMEQNESRLLVVTDCGTHLLKDYDAYSEAKSVITTKALFVLTRKANVAGAIRFTLESAPY